MHWAIALWSLGNLFILANFLRSSILSCLVVPEVTRICHVYQILSHSVSLVVKGKFGKTSQKVSKYYEDDCLQNFFAFCYLY